MKYVEVDAVATQWKKGMRILIKFDDEAFLGTVSRVAADKISIIFDDGDKLSLPPKSRQILGIGVDKKRKSPIPLAKIKDFTAVTKPVKPAKKEVKPTKKTKPTKPVKEVEPTKTAKESTAKVDVDTLKIKASFSLKNWEAYLDELFAILNKRCFGNKLTPPLIRLAKDMGENTRSYYNLKFLSRLNKFEYAIAPKLFNNEAMVRACLVRAMGKQYVYEVEQVPFKSYQFDALFNARMKNIEYTPLDGDAILTKQEQDKQKQIKDLQDSGKYLTSFAKYTPCKFLGKNQKFVLCKIATKMAGGRYVVRDIYAKEWTINPDLLFVPTPEETTTIKR
jgi:hypothetical protein